MKLEIKLYLHLESKGMKGTGTRADVLQVGLQELLHALFSNSMDENLCGTITEVDRVGF